MLLNCRSAVGAGTVCSRITRLKPTLVILTSSVEFIRAESKVNNVLSAVPWLEIWGLVWIVNFGTYRAAHIETLRFPVIFEFVARNRIFNEIQRVRIIGFIRSTPLLESRSFINSD